jgi:hypothetical protein
MADLWWLRSDETDVGRGRNLCLLFAAAGPQRAEDSGERYMRLAQGGLETAANTMTTPLLHRERVHPGTSLSGGGKEGELID